MSEPDKSESHDLNQGATSPQMQRVHTDPQTGQTSPQMPMVPAPAPKSAPIKDVAKPPLPTKGTKNG